MMIRYGSGIVCVPTVEPQLRRLGLGPMVASNRESHRTDFTVSVDAAEGITTGISAYDRTQTIRILADPHGAARAARAARPCVSLRARPGGVLERAGHTEAAVDLAILAGLHPSGVLCELVNDDGTVQRLPNWRNSEEFRPENDLHCAADRTPGPEATPGGAGAGRGPFPPSSANSPAPFSQQPRPAPPPRPYGRSSRPLSTASNSGSTFINIPGPPPNGLVVHRAMPVMRPVAQVVDFQIQQAFFARPHDDAFIERPGKHRREQSQHVNFHSVAALSSDEFFAISTATLNSPACPQQSPPRNAAPSCALPASKSDRMALIVMPCRPMILPTSDGSMRNS